MQTLSKGYKLPQTGDFGTDWFPALEDDIQQLNDHAHNGIDSELISSLYVTAQISSILIAAFTNISPGVERATVTVPGGQLVNNFAITLKDPTTKEVLYLRLEKLNATQFYVYASEPLDVEVYFGI